MNIRVCKDCLYAKNISETNRNKCCTLHYNIRCQLVDKCPMEFNDNDIDWVIAKTIEDQKRGYILYADH